MVKPDGQYALPPMVSEEGVFTVDLDLTEVRRSRQSFDPSGHYSRADVTQLHVNRQRQHIAHFTDDDSE